MAGYSEVTPENTPLKTKPKLSKMAARKERTVRVYINYGETDADFIFTQH